MKFLGSHYEGLSLVITKSLNIVSRVGTLISSDSEDPIFLVTDSGSSGTNITGFNLHAKKGDGIVIQNTDKITISKNNLSRVNKTGIKVTGSSSINIDDNLVNNSKTGVSISNSKNVNVTKNTVKNSADNGVNVERSQNVNINKNKVEENGNDGISVEESENIDVEENSISKNGNNGVKLKNTKKTRINKNSIDSNQGHGVYFDENVDDTQITGNSISSNRGAGIALENSAANTYINGNNIYGNRIGININSNVDNLVITQNTITHSVLGGKEGPAGIGINFGSYYLYSPTFKVDNNVIYGNDRREVEIHDTEQTVIFGANWYGHSDPSMANLCPKLQTQYIQAVVSRSNTGVYTATFYRDYANMIVADGIPSIPVDFKLSNGTYIRVFTENGVATMKVELPLYVDSVKTTFQNHKQEDMTEYTEQKPEEDDNAYVPGGSGGGAGGSGSGLGGGSGSGSDSGLGSGLNGGFSSSSSGGTTSGSSPSSVGAMAAAPVEGSTDSSPGEGGSSGGSSGGSVGSAQELFIDYPDRNSQIWGVIGIVALLMLVIMAYYRKDMLNMIRNSK